MTRRTLACCAGLLILRMGLLGCAEPSEGANGGDGGAESPGLTRDVQPIFDRACASAACHGGESPRAGLSLEPGRSHRALVGRRSRLVEGATLVEPGDPDRSLLLDLLEGEVERDPPTEDGPIERMPPRRSTLPASERALIGEWIRAGARP